MLKKARVIQAQLEARKLEIQRAHSTATSDLKLAKTDIKEVGDMELDSDSEEEKEDSGATPEKNSVSLPVPSEDTSPPSATNAPPPSGIPGTGNVLPPILTPQMPFAPYVNTPPFQPPPMFGGVPPFFPPQPQMGLPPAPHMYPPHPPDSQQPRPLLPTMGHLPPALPITQSPKPTQSSHPVTSEDDTKPQGDLKMDVDAAKKETHSPAKGGKEDTEIAVGKVILDALKSAQSEGKGSLDLTALAKIPGVESDVLKPLLQKVAPKENPSENLTSKIGEVLVKSMTKKQSVKDVLDLWMKGKQKKNEKPSNPGDSQPGGAPGVKVDRSPKASAGVGPGQSTVSSVHGSPPVQVSRHSQQPLPRSGPPLLTGEQPHSYAPHSPKSTKHQDSLKSSESRDPSWSGHQEDQHESQDEDRDFHHGSNDQDEYPVPHRSPIDVPFHQRPFRPPSDGWPPGRQHFRPPQPHRDGQFRPPVDDRHLGRPPGNWPPRPQPHDRPFRPPPDDRPFRPPPDSQPFRPPPNDRSFRPPPDDGPFRPPPNDRSFRPPPDDGPFRPPPDDRPFRLPPDDRPFRPPPDDRPFRPPPDDRTLRPLPPDDRPIRPPPDSQPFRPPPNDRPFRPPPDEGPFRPPPNDRPFRPPPDDRPFRPPPDEGPFRQPPDDRPFRSPPDEGPFRQPPDDHPARPPPGEGHPFRPPPDEERPFRPPPDDDRPFRPPPDEERPFRPPPDEERPFRPPPFEDRPFRSLPNEDRPFRRSPPPFEGGPFRPPPVKEGSFRPQPDGRPFRPLPDDQIRTLPPNKLLGESELDERKGCPPSKDRSFPPQQPVQSPHSPSQSFPSPAADDGSFRATDGHPIKAIHKEKHFKSYAEDNWDFGSSSESRSFDDDSHSNDQKKNQQPLAIKRSASLTPSDHSSSAKDVTTTGNSGGQEKWSSPVQRSPYTTASPSYRNTPMEGGAEEAYSKASSVGDERGSQKETAWTHPQAHRTAIHESGDPEENQLPYRDVNEGEHLEGTHQPDQYWEEGSEQIESDWHRPDYNEGFEAPPARGWRPPPPIPRPGWRMPPPMRRHAPPPYWRGGPRPPPPPPHGYGHRPPPAWQPREKRPPGWSPPQPPYKRPSYD